MTELIELFGRDVAGIIAEYAKPTMFDKHQKRDNELHYDVLERMPTNDAEIAIRQMDMCLLYREIMIRWETIECFYENTKYEIEIRLESGTSLKELTPFFNRMEACEYLDENMDEILGIEMAHIDQDEYVDEDDGSEIEQADYFSDIEDS